MMGYMALHTFRSQRLELGPDDNPHRLHGYPNVTIFKTLRNAFRSAGPEGHILLFDPNTLPIVRLSHVGDIDRKAIVESKAWRWQLRRLEATGRGPFPSSVPHDTEPDPVYVKDETSKTLYEELQQAERQMQMWGERAAAIQKALAQARNLDQSTPVQRAAHRRRSLA